MCRLSMTFRWIEARCFLLYLYILTDCDHDGQGTKAYKLIFFSSDSTIHISL